MTTNVSAPQAGTVARTVDWLDLYRTMVTARVMNDTLKARKTQGKFPFYIGCAGHESLAAVVAALDDEDWLAFYYRDLAGWLQRTKDLHGPLRSAYSRATDPMGGGRNMPSHFSSRKHHIMPGFSEVGSLGPFAGGVGWAFKRDGSRRVVLYTTGDGGAATNDFNVLLRQATVNKLPVLITVWNNHWAITTEQESQWAGDLTAQARAMNAIAVDVDAVNPFEVYDTARDLVEHLRRGEGPAFMHLHGGLLDPHSSSTDIRRYRTLEEIEETTRTKDPVKRMGELLIERGMLQPQDIERIRDEAKAEIDRAEEQVVSEPSPDPKRVLQHVIALPKDQQQPTESPRKKARMIEAINGAFVEIVKRDPGFFVYGQDCGSSIGGVFNATLRLVREYPGTAISSALNEQYIAGIAAGCSMADERARCGEIQFVDYHQSATQTIRLAARVLYQSNGDWTCPMLLRMKSGSGGGGPISDSGSGGGAFGHSNVGDMWFTTVPGLITICPSNPYDAKGLLIAASQTVSPVVFLERGRLYHADVPETHKGGQPIAELAALWDVPEGYYSEPVGKARTLTFGRGAPVATIISWGTMLLESAIAAARYAESGGGAVEVVDLRTLMPFDEEAIQRSVEQTNRVIVVTEEANFTSFGHHILSWIAQKCFWKLDAEPVLVDAVAAPAAPYDAPEEEAFYPSAEDVLRALEHLTHD